MYDTASDASGHASHHLSHDMPCGRCGHAAHTYLACSDTCTCEPVVPLRYAAAELIGV